MENNNLNHRVSLAEKQKIGWYKGMYNYLITRANNDRNIDKVKNRILAGNGIISDSEFQYLIKPVNTSGVKFEIPGKIRDIDFINPIREKSIGSYSQLPYNFQVKVSNPDVLLKRDVALRDEILNYMESQLANAINNLINNQQQQQGVDYQKEIDKLKEKFIADWLDDRAIQGQNIINHLNDVNDYDINRIKAYSYWWMTEEFYTKRSIINGRLIKEVIPPYEIFPIENGEEFVEDYDGVVRCWKMTYTDFMNKMYDILTDEQHKILANNIVKNEEGFYNIPSSIFRMIFDIDVHNDFTDDYTLSNKFGDFTIYHIEFKSETEYKVRHYLNQLGLEKEMVVDNDYVLNPELGDIKLSSIWLSEVYEGYKIGEGDDCIYTKPKPIDVQRRDEIDLRKVKLSYGGKKGIMADILINPIPTRLIPYLVYYKIIHLHIERTLAKYQSSLKFIPKILLEGDDDMSRKEKIWYMKADNTMIYDHTEISPMEVSQGVMIKGDPDIANYIKTLVELRISFKQEAQELANMNDELVGKGDPRGNVTNNQNNIAMARIGSVLSTKIFNKTLAKDLLADLDWSKSVFNKTTTLSYRNEDGSTNYFEVNPDNHNAAYYGMTISDSDADERQLQQYKDWAFNVSQNGDLNISFEAISSENVSGIRKTIRKMIDAKMEMDAKMAEREMAAKEEANAQVKESQQAIINSNERIATMKNNTDIEKALIASDIEIMKIDAASMDNDKDKDGKDDDTELLIKQATLRLAERAQTLAEQQFNSKVRMDSHKINIDNKNLEIKKSKLTSK